MKSATPDLIIELNIECPHCEGFFDILEECSVDDRGVLLDMVLPEGHWSVEHDKFEETIRCPYCKKEFMAKGVNW